MKRTILLIQSAQTQGNGTKAHLEDRGYKVIWAGSGLTALILARNELIDLILLDVALPDIEGLDLCRRFRKREDTYAVPIILLTARGYTPERHVGEAAGPDDYLAKPYTDNELELKIAAVLAMKSASLPSAPDPKPEPKLKLVWDSAKEMRAKADPLPPEPMPALKTLVQVAPVPDFRPAPKAEPRLPQPALAERRDALQEPATARTPARHEAQAERLPLPSPVSAESPLPAVHASPIPPFHGSSDAVVDPATGLFGRPQFEAMFSKEFKRALRFKQQVSCMLINLDGANMGRQADETLVRAIIKLVQHTIREVDTAAWWTGEAFIVLLPNTIRNDAVQAAARILEAVANHPFTWPDSTKVAVSIGVAGLPDRNVDTEAKLIEAAQAACVRARDNMLPSPLLAPIRR